MNEHFKDNEKKEKLSSIVVVRKYKKKSGIESKGYSDKIKSILDSMDKEIINMKFTKISWLSHTKLSRIIQERFEELDEKHKKDKLCILINSKFRNFSSINLKAQKENNSFSKLIINKFRNSYKGGQ